MGSMKWELWANKTIIELEAKLADTRKSLAAERENWRALRKADAVRIRVLENALAVTKP